MPDINYWLGIKYGLMQQQAAADTVRANAGMLSAQSGANLDNVRAGLLPGESTAGIGLTRAQAAAQNANAANTAETTRFIAPLAQASIRGTDANAYANRQQGGLYGAQAYGENQLSQLVGLGMRPPSTIDTARRGFRFGTNPLDDPTR